MGRAFVVCCVALLACPAAARAEWHLTPTVGVTMLGRTSLVDSEQASNKPHLHGGAAVSWLSRGLFGLEGLVIWTPGFFEGDPSFPDARADVDFVTSSRALSVMGNLVVTLPQRWTEYGLRPYVSGGVGLMHAAHSGPSSLFPAEVKVLGINIGGGAVGFFSPRTGVRFEVRYHSTLNTAENAPAFGEAHLRYVTASIGIVFRRGHSGRF